MSIHASFAELTQMLPKEARQSYLTAPSTEQIEKASIALSSKISGVQLPAEIIALYETCGGQPWETSFEHQLFPGFCLNPIERAIEDYKEQCNLWEINVAEYEDSEFPNKWFDYRLFPFGWAPGTGSLYCIDVIGGKVYHHNPDGGTSGTDYESISNLIEVSIEYHKKEFDR